MSNIGIQRLGSWTFRLVGGCRIGHLIVVTLALHTLTMKRDLKWWLQAPERSWQAAWNTGHEKSHLLYLANSALQ